MFYLFQNQKLTVQEKNFLERLYINEHKRMWYAAYKTTHNKTDADDIADTLNISITAARLRVFYGRKILRKNKGG